MNPGVPRNISFRVETLYASKNNRIGRIKPDENGIYRGLPMMTLGEITQQQTYYDPASMVEQITNPDTRFSKIFRAQKLLGEISHPQFYGLNDSDKLNRLVTVEEERASHLFTGIYTDAPSSEGTVVVRADVKPTGPYGAVFKESLDDPVINTSFSLRAYVSTEMKPNGVKYRTVRQLTTWDHVGASGYYGTDKAHAIGLESFSGEEHLEYEMNLMADGNFLLDQIALETYTDTDLNEIFGMTKIQRVVQTRTLIEGDRDLTSRFPNLYPTALFNEHFREV